MINTILVTGGAGFIGSNFIRLLLSKNEYKIINLDSLTYAGNLANLEDVQENNSYKFVKGSIQDKQLLSNLFEEEQIDAIINFAAESHVDRSIINSSPFVDTNINGTVCLLDIAKNYKINRYLQVSTDEVYGSLGDEGYFTEQTPLSPNSPYSASKASADMMVNAYHHTFGLPTLITRCSNNYGPFQFPEKLIPLMILNALENKDLPVYGDGKNVRDWIFVEDHCEAIFEVFEKGNIGEVYNIGGRCEKRNIEIVELILAYLQKPKTLIKYVSDRPGHDKRYAIDNSKIQKQLLWTPKYEFDSAIQNTIEWYLNNLSWSQKIRSGEYMNFYNQLYSNR